MSDEPKTLADEENEGSYPYGERDMAAYVLDGPANCGNIFGFYRQGMIPDGAFAVVEDGEYANGGTGPSVAISTLFRCRERAERAAADLNRQQEDKT